MEEESYYWFRERFLKNELEFAQAALHSPNPPGPAQKPPSACIRWQKVVFADRLV
jgi:hypothetical protein